MTRDLNGLRAAIKQALPGLDIRVEGLGDGVVLTGNVSSPIEAQQAFDIASRLVDDGKKVVNGIAVHGRDQVMLKVTVAEVQRDVIKQLGIDLSGSVGFGSAVLNFNNTKPFPVYGQPLVPVERITGTWKSISATLRAMERAGVIRTLAEPNLTAISGESANFLAGGEFPIPAGYTCVPGSSPQSASTQIQWKKFGVGLNFTPVVLAEGRISLKVMTEVSELSTENQLTLVQSIGSSTTLTIPSIKTRRAETTVEIPSGGSLAMAGMIAGADQAADQRHSGTDAAADPRRPVQEPRLHQQADRADGPGHALCGARGGAEGIVAARRRICRRQRPRTILLGKFNRIYGVAGKADPKVDLSRQARLHSRLRAASGRRSMSFIRSSVESADRRGAARLLALVGCAGHARRLLHRRRGSPRRPRSTIACATRSRSRKAPRTVELFIGSNRGGLTGDQRADVLAFANSLAARGDRRHRDRAAVRHAQRGRRRQCLARGARDPRRPPASRRMPWPCGPTGRSIRASSPRCGSTIRP